MRIGIAGLALALALAVAPNGPAAAAGARHSEPGPVPIRVLSVHDGDTFTARLPDGRRESVRVVGVDTPEIGGFERCTQELEAGLRARDAAVAALEAGKSIVLLDLRWGVDRWGRLLARVEIDGRDLAETLIGQGLGRRYDGGRRREWCAP